MNNSSETTQNGSYLGSYTSRFASRLLKSSEIEDEEIKLITKLGSGTFGTVWKGECFSSTYAPVHVIYFKDYVVFIFACSCALGGFISSFFLTSIHSICYYSVAIKVPIPEKASALTREEIEYLRNEINIMTYVPELLFCFRLRAGRPIHMFIRAHQSSSLLTPFLQNQPASKPHPLPWCLHRSEQVQDRLGDHGWRPGASADQICRGKEDDLMAADGSREGRRPRHALASLHEPSHHPQVIHCTSVIPRVHVRPCDEHRRSL